MSEGELKNRLKECLRTDGKSEKLGMSGVIDEAAIEYPTYYKAADRAQQRHPLLKLYRKDVLEELLQMQQEWGQKWLGAFNSSSSMEAKKE